MRFTPLWTLTRVLVLASVLGLPCPARSGPGDRGGQADSGILLVRGTSSTPNEAERNYAQAVTRRLSRWLSELGVAHRVVDDEQVTPALLGEARVAVLGYNPFPPRRELALLKSYLKLGGKLVVFYGAEPALAEWMGLKLGRYVAAETTNGWSAMRFAGPLHGLPERVRQQSRNIRPAYPAADTAQVLAYWEDAAGRITREPACVQSPAGFWISHVLLDDGDTEGKKQMLLALLGAHVPSAWQAAAAGYLQGAGQVGGFKGLHQAVQGIRGLAQEPRAESTVLEALAQAQAAHGQAAEWFERGAYPQAVQKAREARQLLIQAYGRTQGPRTGEVRGVWDHSATGLYPGQWERTCALLKAHGITDLFVNMVWPGLAYYPSEVLPRADAVRTHGDQLAQCLAAARQHGLRVHVWKVCWRVDGAPADLLAELKRQGRLQVTDGGATINWLCPSREENLRWEKDAVREIVRGYPVDGIHLDYVRYQNSHACYCAECRRRFEDHLERRLRPWPAAVLKGPLRSEFLRWRCTRITRLVRDVAALARAADGRLRVSAAVYGKYPSCVDGVGQDWVTWLQEGCLDFICPMNYTADLERFTQLTRSQIGLAGSGAKVLPGIGVTATESQLDPAAVIDQIAALRREGAAGFVLFSLNPTLERETLPVLRLGTMADL